MTPKRPIEVALASRACGEAWLRRDRMVDAGDEVGVLAMNQACDILGGHYNSLWEKWQNMGGTSDIESLALHEVGKRGTYKESALTKKTKAEAAARKPWISKGYTGADSRGTVDVSDIPPYSSHEPMKHKGGSYDQHESHAWTVDGE